VCVGDLVETDALGNTRPDGASCNRPKSPLQIQAGCSARIALIE
jgi:hypothetical protein